MASVTDDGVTGQDHRDIIENIVRKNARMKQDISEIHEEQRRQILEMKDVVLNVLDSASDLEQKVNRRVSGRNIRDRQARTSKTGNISGSGEMCIGPESD